MNKAFFLSERHPCLSFENNQYIALATGLGWGTDNVPNRVDIWFPKSDRIITFALDSEHEKHFFYKTVPGTPSQFAHLSMMVFDY
jgi:hypothetical protein